MIHLENMTVEEFPHYREIFIKDYGQELSENYKYTLEAGLIRAEKEIDEDLPEGTLTSENELKTIVLAGEQNNEVVGYLWYVKHKNGDSVFIYDFFIFKPFRSQGYGSLALKELEKLSAQMDIKDIKLRVAYFNQRALKLYKELGFEITGINMMKKLTAT